MLKDLTYLVRLVEVVYKLQERSLVDPEIDQHRCIRQHPATAVALGSSLGDYNGVWEAPGLECLRNGSRRSAGLASASLVVFLLIAIRWRKTVVVVAIFIVA
jgi:hypothetical protein